MLEFAAGFICSAPFWFVVAGLARAAKEESEALDALNRDDPQAPARWTP